MQRVELLYRWLARDKRPESHAAVGEALRHAEVLYVDRLASILVDKRSPRACAGLIAHYERLSPGLRKDLENRPKELQAGLAEAMKSSDETTRQNALALLRDQKSPQLSYLAADALRDGSRAVQEAAAETLEGITEHALTLDDHEARKQVSQSLRDALRSFERHEQQRVLKACLWFARDLDDGLWQTLDDSKQAAAHVVAKQLEAWDDPRLAGFLLVALQHAAWRRPALQILQRWNLREHLVALLKHSDLLDLEVIRHELQHVERPAWFYAGDPRLGDLPESLRGHMARWALHVGLSEAERIKCLERWQRSPYPDVHRAAVHALAALGGPQAARVMAQIAERNCPMRQFAQWYITGRRAAVRAGKLAEANRRTQRTAAAPAGGTQAEVRS
jgi:hypothetical protein